MIAREVGAVGVAVLTVREVGAVVCLAVGIIDPTPSDKDKEKDISKRFLSSDSSKTSSKLLYCSMREGEYKSLSASMRVRIKLNLRAKQALHRIHLLLDCCLLCIGTLLNRLHNAPISSWHAVSGPQRLLEGLNPSKFLPEGLA